MSFCSLKKGITPKIRMLCFVLINGVLLNLLCVNLVDQNGFYTQTTQSEILNQKKKKKKKEQKTHKAVVLTVQTVLEINVATSPDYLLCWGLTVIVGWAI